MNTNDNENVPWWTVAMVGSELQELEKVITSGYLNEGRVVTEFENIVAEKIGVKHAIACSSGTVSLFLSLRALGIGRGDFVVVPNMTFIATANAVRLAGAEVILADVNPKTLTISLESIRKLWGIKNFKAIIPVHVSGRSAITQELLDFANDNKILIVEDSAESFMSIDPTSKRYLGTIGNAGIFSFSPNKLITSGQGGMVVTDDEEIAKRVRRLKDQGRPERGTGGADLHSYEGYNFKLTNLQAAVGLAQMRAIDLRIKHLKNVYSFYRTNIKDCQHIQLLPFDIEAGELPLWPEIICYSREAILTKLVKMKIEFREIWFPISTQDPYKSTLADVTNSLKINEKGFWLPSSFSLTDEHLKRVVAAMKCEVC